MQLNKSKCVKNLVVRGYYINDKGRRSYNDFQLTQLKLYYKKYPALKHVIVDSIFIWPNNIPTAKLSINNILKRLNSGQGQNSNYKNNIEKIEDFPPAIHVYLTQPPTPLLDKILTNETFREKYFEDEKNKAMMPHVISAADSTGRRRAGGLRPIPSGV